MSKSLIIFGSSRSDGNTKKAIEAFNIENLFPFVDLSCLDITPYDYQNKNQDDDYLKLMEQVLNYQNIILATPVYWYSVSAQMKIFIDRLTDCITIRKDIGKALKGKKVYLIASYSTSKPLYFEEPIRETCVYMGMEYQGCFFHYSGSNLRLLEENQNIADFRRQII